MAQKHVPVSSTTAKQLVKIGQRVRLVRKARGHTSFTLAAALGMSQAHVSRIETGQQGLRCVTVLQLAKVLNVSPMIFFMEPGIARRMREALPEGMIRGIELIG